MKRYMIPFVVASIVFVLTVFFLNQLEEKPNTITAELSALVAKDDNFQLFYLRKGVSQFSEKESIKVPVKGNSEIQTIKFVIPVEEAIEKIRLDFGNNRAQLAIKVEALAFQSIHTRLAIKIEDYFTPNTFIKVEYGQYYPLLINDNYDPFLVSNVNLDDFFQQLLLPQKTVPKLVIFLLALIFFLAIFLTLLFKEIKVEQVRSKAYIFFFFGILLTPTIVKQFDLEKNVIIQEKRVLASKPAFAFEKEYPQKFEQYYNDNFGLRASIINWASSIKTSVFNSSPKPKIAQFGEDGFIYLASGYAIEESYSNSNLISAQQLESIYQKKLALKNELAQRNIPFIIGFWPNKHSIYSENLPFSMKMQIKNDRSLADQVVAYFKEKKFNFFDVRQDLLAAKKDQQLYQKFDTHWNSTGAFVAYQAFCKQTFDELGLSPFKTTDFDIELKPTRTGDLVFMLGMEKMSHDEDILPEYTLKDQNKNYHIIEDKSLPKYSIVTLNEHCNNEQTVLVFRDSYCTNLIPFLSLHYHKVVYIACSDVPYFDMNLVNQVNPDMVFAFGLERYLSLLLE